MRILSWNLNGIKACIRNGDFEQFKKLPEIDIMCFQETRTQDKMQVLKDYHHYWYPAEQKHYSGTLTLTLVKPMKVIYGIGNNELDKEGRVITIDMGKLYVVNTYVPNSQGGPAREEFRRKWDSVYSRFMRNLAFEKPVIACGDFNVTMARIDVYKENERISQTEQGWISDERNNLQNLIDMGFVDAFRYLYPDEENAFTWWSNRRYKRNDDRGWRLDYFFVTEENAEQIMDVKHHQEITGSDHCPILLEYENRDEAYDIQYSEAISDKHNREAEERRLGLMWANRQRHFKKYEEQLAIIQAEITAYTTMRRYDEVRERQMRIMDDIRFRCLAVNKVAKVAAPVGVDNIKWRTNAEKMQAAIDLDWRGYEAKPKRMIEVKAKQTGKVRRTGILTYRDKAMSILCGYTFSPIEEAYGDRSSFAFRPGRSRQDAALAIANLFEGKDAPDIFIYLDIKGFYATLQHKWIMKHVPIVKDVLHSFLKAGHIFERELFPSSDYGISEASPLSPMVANFTLDGMQRAIYLALHGKVKDIDFEDGAMVRYADDVIVAVRTPDAARMVLSAVKEFLEPRGLIISEEKTLAGSIWSGFETIGFFIKKEVYGISIRPKLDAVLRFKCGIHEFIMNCNSSQREMIETLNKKLKGWAGQYRFCDAYDSYREIDVAVAASLLEAATLRHPKMQTAKLIKKYWYTDGGGEKWYALPKEKDVRVIHLRDTLLTSQRRCRTDINPYLQIDYFQAKKRADDIDRVNSKYRPVWEKFNGKCLYCGRPILPEHPKCLVTIDHKKPEALWNSAYVHEICVLSDYQFLMTVEDVDGITDYDVFEKLKRISISGTTILDKGLPLDWKYMKLYEFFAESTKPRIMLTFKQIEEILGFELSDSVKTTSQSWYPRKFMHKMADAWILQGYKLERLYMKQQKALFVAQFEDAELINIPPEILDRKVPINAKHEIEHFLQSIIKKYGLTQEDVIPRM